MKMRKVLIVLIILLTFLLRAYKTDLFPSGFYSDETLFGYEAYSLLKTGKDQFGNKLPAIFKAFGDYRPGLYIYTAIPFIELLGLNEYATRLPAILISTLTGFLIIFLCLELFLKSRQALLAGWIFAVSPWSLQFARMAHETNLATLLVLAGIYFLLKSTKQEKYIILSLISFSISLYAYYTTRVFVPLFLLSIAIIYFTRFIRPNIKYIFIGVLSSFIILLPLLIALSNSSASWSRIDAVSLWGDAGIKASTIQYRQEDTQQSVHYARLFHNKLTDGFQKFVDSYLIHFEPKFLLLNGDPNLLYNTPGMGILYILEPFMIIIAVMLSYQYKNTKYGWLMLLWIIIGLLPDALTRYSPAAARIHLILPLVCIISALGMDYLFRSIRPKRPAKVLLLSGISVILIWNILYYLHSYYFHLSVRYARIWHYGMKEVVNKSQEMSRSHNKVWVSSKIALWVDYLFYLKYPPRVIQQEIKLTPKNEYGLGKVLGFGKYHFDDIPQYFDYNTDIVYVGRPEEFPKNAIPDEIIYDPNKMPAYYMVTTQSLKTTCPIRCNILFTQPNKHAY